MYNHKSTMWKNHSSPPSRHVVMEPKFDCLCRFLFSVPSFQINFQLTKEEKYRDLQRSCSSEFTKQKRGPDGPSQQLATGPTPSSSDSPILLRVCPNWRASRASAISHTATVRDIIPGWVSVANGQIYCFSSVFF